LFEFAFFHHILVQLAMSSQYLGGTLLVMPLLLVLQTKKYKTKEVPRMVLTKKAAKLKFKGTLLTTNAKTLSSKLPSITHSILIDSYLEP
jgi:hypothetical protein